VLTQVCETPIPLHNRQTLARVRKMVRGRLP
jgi:hypothetical protein